MCKLGVRGGYAPKGITIKRSKGFIRTSSVDQNRQLPQPPLLGAGLGAQLLDIAQAEVLVGTAGGDATARGALQGAELGEERLRDNPPRRGPPRPRRPPTVG